MVIFDEFSGYEKCVEKFKKSLTSFDENDKENSFFDAITYGMKFKLKEEKNITKNEVESVLGGEFYKNFCESRESLPLDTSLFGFFNKCALINEFLTKKIFFLRLYERRDKFRYLIKKGAFGDNKTGLDLSSSVIEKFNGYEILKRGLRNKEKKILVQQILYMSRFPINKI